jgi:hypothetical protein
MAETIKIAPVNSQVVIVDPNSKKVEVPDYRESVPFVATSSCILFYCFPEVDGETEITLGKASEVDPGHAPVFDGHLLTASKTLAIETVEGDTILQTPTSGVQTKLRIWSNAIKWPTKIVVGID